MTWILSRIRRAIRRMMLRAAPPSAVSPFVRLSKGRGFNIRYLVFWESIPDAVLVHFEEGSHFLVEGEEGGNLLRMLNALAVDPMVWARGHPVTEDGN